MSYPDQPEVTRAGQGRPRPAVVVLAAAILVAMALGGLAHAVAGLVTLNGTVAGFRDAAGRVVPEPDRIETVVTLLRTATVLATVLAVLVAVLLVVFALGLLAGGNGVRVATWTVCGLGLLCGCGGLAVLIGQRAVPLGLDPDDVSTAELLNALAGAYPSWWIPVNAALSVGQVLGYVVVAALLALPAASAYFRRRSPDRPVS